VQATCSSPPSLPRVPLHSAPSPLPALQDVAKVAPSSILPHVDTPDSAATLPNREPLDDPDLPELTAARAIPLILGALALGLLAAIVLVLLLTRRPKPAVSPGDNFSDTDSDPEDTDELELELPASANACRVGMRRSEYEDGSVE